jgi:hypothetical protein
MMLWTQSYVCGACRRWWVPFRPPFATVGERFVKNTIRSTIKLIMLLFKRFILNPVNALSSDPSGRGYPRKIRSIHRYHAIEGANGTTMVVMFVGLLWWGWRASPYYSYYRNPTWRKFFIPTQTLIGVQLFSDHKAHQKSWHIYASFVVNSFTAKDGPDRPLFNELFWWLVTSTIFVRC